MKIRAKGMSLSAAGASVFLPGCSGFAWACHFDTHSDLRLAIDATRARARMNCGAASPIHLAGFRLPVDPR